MTTKEGEMNITQPPQPPKSARKGRASNSVASVATGGAGLAAPWAPIHFFVPGVPVPGGSKKGFVVRGRVCIVDAAGQRNKNWRAVVALAAKQHWRGPLLDEALKVTVTFTMPRPKSHFLNWGQLKISAPTLHTIRPDVLKLTRAVEDALTGVIWTDDSLIAQESMEKRYGTSPGAWILIEKAVL